MRTATFVLVIGGIAGLATLPATAAHAVPVLISQASEPAIQQVWYDRWGRWHPRRYRYGYGRPSYYAYGPPHGQHRYWRHRRMQCLRYGAC